MKTVEQISLDHLLSRSEMPAGAVRALREALERARVVAVLDGWANLVDTCERGCQGHDEGRGVTEYCDGSCRTPASLKRFERKHWWVESATTANGLPGLTVATDDGDQFPITPSWDGPDAARAAAALAIEQWD